ncbi:MAG: hypothetical protein CMJ65_10640 [Planctomycetaceae bacterium]|jgi:anti-anti-sigma factor|nr:hypothetical protein [Planctomycetaceae bacterium]MDP7277428.1 STAS domain-containing protein [Planctomycetaceae bacterium]
MSLDGFSSRHFLADIVDDAVVASFHPGILDEEGNVELLGQSLFQLVDHHRFCRIIVDLSEISFVSSSVLGKLISLHRKLHRAGGGLILCGLQEPVEMVLRRSNLLDYFQVVPGRDAALDFLKTMD